MAEYIPSVTVDEFSRIVRRQFESQLKRPIFGLGKGGIGKSESIAQLAQEELHIGYKDIRLLLYGESDLKGIPYVNKEHSHTIWLQNDILPQVERDGERGILVLDEVTSCGKAVRTAAYQLLNERCLGDYHLPEGWMIVCLGNGEEDGGHFSGMEGNFANRCSVFQVVSQFESWKKWALQANIHPLVLSYISWRPEHLHSYSTSKEDEFLFASPRSWKAVSDILYLYPFEDDPLTALQIQGNIGLEVGNPFLRFCQSHAQTVSAHDILQGVEVVQPQSQEILLLTIQAVIALLTAEFDKLEELFQSGDLEEASLFPFVHGIRWMLSLEKLEYQMMAVRDFIASNQKGTALLLAQPLFASLCPEFREFITENHWIFRP